MNGTSRTSLGNLNSVSNSLAVNFENLQNRPLAEIDWKIGLKLKTSLLSALTPFKGICWYSDVSKAFYSHH